MVWVWDSATEHQQEMVLVAIVKIASELARRFTDRLRSSVQTLILYLAWSPCVSSLSRKQVTRLWYQGGLPRLPRLPRLHPR